MIKGYQGYLAGLLIIAGLFAVSCGGGTATAPAPEAPSPALGTEVGFPGLPMGELPRESNVLDMT